MVPLARFTNNAQKKLKWKRPR